MIEARELTKRYGDTTAVHSLSSAIAPGTGTGFLGPNGAGQPTTMRMIMGLDRPTSGTVTVDRKPYRQHRAPLREVGALLEASAVHPGRSARSHLATESGAAPNDQRRRRRTGGVPKRPGAGPLPVMGDAIPLESTLVPHATPSRLRELWEPCGHGTRTSRSKIKRHAVDLGFIGGAGGA